jgi:hypothetical protein
MAKILVAPTDIGGLCTNKNFSANENGAAILSCSVTTNIGGLVDNALLIYWRHPPILVENTLIILGVQSITL